MLFTTEPLSSLEALLLSFPICFPGVSIFFFFHFFILKLFSHSFYLNC